MTATPLYEEHFVVAGRATLIAFNKQIRQLSQAIQDRECALIEIGRQHARNFDAGHTPSGGGAERVLAQLRRIAQREERDTAKTSAQQPAVPAKSDLDDLRTRRANRAASLVQSLNAGVRHG